MKVSKIIFALVFGVVLTLSNTAFAQHDGHDHDGHNHGAEQHDGHDHSGHDHAKQNHDAHGAKAGHQGGDHDHDHGGHHVYTTECGGTIDHSKFDAGATAFHHIADANIYTIGPLKLPLPCILYTKGQGWDIFSSGKFHAHGHHGDGTTAVNGYILDAGTVRRIADPSFPQGEVNIGEHVITHEKVMVDGKERESAFVCHGGKKYATIANSTLDGGLFGGGLTPFYDMSMTKNVVSMILVALFLLWLFVSIAGMYKRNAGKAPTGKQGFFEPMFVFIQDEVAKPFLGDKWKKYLPFLLTLFFFILGLNLFGQIPFFGGSNVTGNLAFTAVIAIIAFFVVNLSGNKHYWEHVLWMPGVPAWLKLTILTPVEIIGLFIKPITLMLRLFANITAGHIVIIVFISLIFIFKEKAGIESGVAVGMGTSLVSILLSLFMMTIELLVAFIQAFVFTILTAAYIGAAIEDGHHDDHEEAHAHAH